jgi:heat shock protein HslJ
MMLMTKVKLPLWLAVFAASIFVLTGCAASADPLNGTDWDLQSYNGTSPIEGRALTASFEKGQISGSAGCNSYGGTYQIHGDQITISQLYSTEMACMDPEGIMDQEQRFLKALSGAQTFQVATGQLKIFGANREILTFIPKG